MDAAQYLHFAREITTHCMRLAGTRLAVCETRGKTLIEDGLDKRLRGESATGLNHDTIAIRRAFVSTHL